MRFLDIKTDYAFKKVFDRANIVVFIKEERLLGFQDVKSVLQK